MQDVMSVKSAIGEYGNPFLETSSDILVLNTLDIVETSCVYNVYRMESQGCQQLKSDRKLVSRLFVESQFRDGNLNDYFSHKNQPCPPSLSARGKLKLGTKLDIVRCLQDSPEKQDDITPSVHVVMFDGPAMLCVLKPSASGTLREYACPGCVPTLCGTSTG